MNAIEIEIELIYLLERRRILRKILRVLDEKPVYSISEASSVVEAIDFAEQARASKIEQYDQDLYETELGIAWLLRNISIKTLV